MYSHCLFCSRDLGRNEAIEAFPVGRRLAYDAAKGRLWVVCTACGRWNLTPLEQRWEAIEQAERLFERARLRSATDNIGLARVCDRTDLVRIGRPLRPEFAAWRYGRVLTRRRLHHNVHVAPVTAVSMIGMSAAVSAVMYVDRTLTGGAAGAVAATAVTATATWLLRATERRTVQALLGSAISVVARLRDPHGNRLVVRRGHLAESTLGGGGNREFVLVLRHDDGVAELSGDAARRAAALVVPALNPGGADAATVDRAVQSVGTRGGSHEYLRTILAWAPKATRPLRNPPNRWTAGADVPSEGLYGLAPTQRLALEMALHEEQERAALDGELRALEQAWQEAEEIAAIADDLVLPGRVRQGFARLRRARDGRTDPPRGAA